MLAYALSLDHSQISEQPRTGAPLVVVDDCALSGIRFGRFLRRLSHEKIIFAHLYSYPELRSAIERREGAVVACIAAQDLRDADSNAGGGGTLDRDFEMKWTKQFGEEGYYLRRTEQLGFAWAEPDRIIWNPTSGEIEDGWGLLPPALCLKRRSSVKSNALVVQVQPDGVGTLRPSNDVLFCEYEGQIVIGNLASNRTLGLNAVGSDMWRAVVRDGNIEDACARLLRQYGVDEDRLWLDLSTFVDGLVRQGLLHVGDAADDEAK